MAGADFVPPTFWTRFGTLVHSSARAREMDLYYDRFVANDVDITFVSLPV